VAFQKLVGGIYMGRIGRYFRHLILGMVQGCLILAIIAAILAVVTSLIIYHTLPQGYSFFLTIAVIVVSGLLGALASLVWRLTHIGDLVRLTQNVVQGKEGKSATRDS
jgi:hypothetical protein